MAVLQKLTEKRLLTLIICLVIIGWILQRVVFVPMSMELDGIRTETSAINQKIAALPVMVHDLRRMRDDYAQAVSALESINSRVTSEAALPYFIRELEDVSKQAGTNISSVSMGTLAAGSYCSRIPMTITFQGSYRQVERFIQGLAKLERAVSVSDLRLESPGFTEHEDIGNEHVLDAALSLVVYVVPKGGDS
jgi:Tfp pilus assembly protein PilO